MSERPPKAAIYTRGGDAGETGLIGPDRVRKDDPRIEAYGTVDELSSFVGFARVAVADVELLELLARVQDDLFVLGADLATQATGDDRPPMPMLAPEDVERLEGWIDRYDAQMPPLRQFVLPGGSESAARLHLARTVCRRAERAVVALGGARAENLRYLNRLSDLLFTLARWANHAAGVADVPWTKR